MDEGYVALDLEWNQGWYRGRTCCELLQIGAVRLDAAFRVTGRFSAYLRPVYLRRLSPRVLELTGADAETLRQGEDFRAVWPRFAAFCGQATALTWGPSDEDMLRRNLALYELPCAGLPPFYDVQLAYLTVAGLSAQPALDTAVEALGLTQALPYHNAENDAWYTAAVARALAEKLGALPSAQEIEARRRAALREKQAARTEQLRQTLGALLEETAPVRVACTDALPAPELVPLSMAARQAVCPACGWHTGVNTFYHFAPQRYLARARCPAHGPLYLTLSVQPDGAGGFSGQTRQLAPSAALNHAYRQARDLLPALPVASARRRPRKRKTADRSGLPAPLPQTKGG